MPAPETGAGARALSRAQRPHCKTQSAWTPCECAVHVKWLRWEILCHVYFTTKRGTFPSEIQHKENNFLTKFKCILPTVAKRHILTKMALSEKKMVTEC